MIPGKVYQQVKHCCATSATYLQFGVVFQLSADFFHLFVDIHEESIFSVSYDVGANHQRPDVDAGHWEMQ